MNHIKCIWSENYWISLHGVTAYDPEWKDGACRPFGGLLKNIYFKYQLKQATSVPWYLWYYYYYYSFCWVFCTRDDTQRDIPPCGHSQGIIHTYTVDYQLVRNSHVSLLCCISIRNISYPFSLSKRCTSHQCLNLSLMMFKLSWKTKTIRYSPLQ